MNQTAETRIGKGVKLYLAGLAYLDLLQIRFRDIDLNLERIHVSDCHNCSLRIGSGTER
jgi:hypothetical protein